MKELNDLESKLVECNRYGYCANELAVVAEAFRALEQRAEAAEAKLAELDKQEPYCWHDGSDYLLEGCWEAYKTGHHTVPVYAQPAPAINLADLVEASANKDADEIIHLFDGVFDDRSRAWSLANAVWDACHAAMLRNIEEQSK